MARQKASCVVCGAVKGTECDPLLHAAADMTTGGPAALVEGSFALYKTDRGDLLLVTEIPGRGIERKVFPKSLVRLVMGGPIGKMLARTGGDS